MAGTIFMSLWMVVHFKVNPSLSIKDAAYIYTPKWKKALWELCIALKHNAVILATWALTALPGVQGDSYALCHDVSHGA